MTADDTENLTSDEDSCSSWRNAVATTLRLGVSTTHCPGRGLMMWLVRHGEGVGGSGVGAGLGTSVSFTVAFMMNSYDATYTNTQRRPTKP